MTLSYIVVCANDQLQFASKGSSVTACLEFQKRFEPKKGEAEIYFLYKAMQKTSERYNRATVALGKVDFLQEHSFKL